MFFQNRVHLVSVKPLASATTLACLRGGPGQRPGTAGAAIFLAAGRDTKGDGSGVCPSSVPAWTDAHVGAFHPAVYICSLAGSKL